MRLRVGVLACAAAFAVATAAQGAGSPAIFTIAGGNTSGFAGDGRPATGAQLNGPAATAIAPDGAVIVADTINQRVRRIDPATQRISTIAGNGSRGFSGDGGPATGAKLQDPTALAVTKDGALLIADTGNNRVRRVGADGTITTVAGSSEQGFAGDGGPATGAQLTEPAGLAVDEAGRVYIADSGNNRVRAIEPNGRIETIAGTGQAGAAGDGGRATQAQLNGPSGLAIEANGSLLIADTGNNKVRRVAPSGTISTAAGTGAKGSAGDGGPAGAAQLNSPTDVAAVPSGGFFVAESGGNRIRHVDAQGNIARVAGTGGPRFRGDGRAAVRSLLNAPRAVELMPSGVELLIADTDNNRVRYVAVPGQAVLLALAPLKPAYRGKLVKVKRGGHRELVVRDPRISVRITRASTLTIRIRKKRGPRVATWRTSTNEGTGTIRVPKRLLAGKRRLTKGHYVVGVTAKSGTATAATSVPLVVR